MNLPLINRGSMITNGRGSKGGGGRGDDHVEDFHRGFGVFHLFKGGSSGQSCLLPGPWDKELESLKRGRRSEGECKKSFSLQDLRPRERGDGLFDEQGWPGGTKGYSSGTDTDDGDEILARSSIRGRENRQRLCLLVNVWTGLGGREDEVIFRWMSLSVTVTVAVNGSGLETR